MILNSATYRQSSKYAQQGDAVKQGSVTAAQIDPDNHLLSRFPLQRLDAESIRDGMLAVGGELDLTSGGPYVPTKRDAEGDVIVDKKTAGTHRRSVYLQQRRTQVVGMLEVFDTPSIVFSCTYRAPTTVPLQSLKLLNSSFVRDRAEALTQRVLKMSFPAGTALKQRIEYAFALTCSRPPTAVELAAAKKFLAEQPSQYHGRPNAEELAWIDLCQMLLSSNAFLYID